MKTNGSTRKTTLFSTIRYEHLVAGFSGGVTSTLILHPLDLIKIRFAGRIPVFVYIFFIFCLFVWTNAYTIIKPPPPTLPTKITRVMITKSRAIRIQFPTRLSICFCFVFLFVFAHTHSKRWSHDNNATVSWFGKRFYHHFSTRGSKRSIQRGHTKCMRFGQCMGILLFIVSFHFSHTLSLSIRIQFNLKINLFSRSYNSIKTWIQKGNSATPLGPTMHMIAAAEAGILTLVMTNPIWVVKTRLCLQYGRDLQTAETRYNGMIDALSKIYRQEGVRGLYRVRRTEQNIKILWIFCYVQHNIDLIHPSISFRAFCLHQ